MSGEVKLERAGPIGWLVFDNPERHNAVNTTMIDHAMSHLERVSTDDSVRVVALRGAGDLAFVSGADITGLAAQLDGVKRPDIRDVMAAVSGLSKPVIAAIRGWCLGAGVLLALAADLRFAGPDLRLGIPAAKLGIAYPMEGVAKIVALGGPGVAAELLLTGEPLDAEGALRSGLINRVVRGDDLFEVVQGAAEAMASNAPLSLVAAKRTIRAVQEPGDADATEAALRAEAACIDSRDLQEGRAAFTEKRPPTFEGR
jgi:enoyl-CoA hydratase/carnithine racemase